MSSRRLRHTITPSTNTTSPAIDCHAPTHDLAAASSAAVLRRCNSWAASAVREERVANVDADWLCQGGNHVHGQLGGSEPKGGETPSLTFELSSFLPNDLSSTMSLSWSCTRCLNDSASP